MKADHKAALKIANFGVRAGKTDWERTLAAAYLEHDTQLRQANQLNETLTRDLLKLRELAKDAAERMDRARSILSPDKTEWAMLDTQALHAAIGDDNG